MRRIYWDLKDKKIGTLKKSEKLTQKLIFEDIKICFCFFLLQNLLIFWHSKINSNIEKVKNLNLNLN